MKRKHSFDLKVWLWPGEQGAWHFVSLPKPASDELHERYKTRHRGWNSIKVRVTIEKTVWETSIFWSVQSGQYILPLKAKVRAAEGVYEGDRVKVKLELI